MVAIVSKCDDRILVLHNYTRKLFQEQFIINLRISFKKYIDKNSLVLNKYLVSLLEMYCRK